MKRVFVGLVLFAACKNESSRAAPGGDASASASAAPVASTPPAPKPIHYSGTYTSVPGSLYVPDGGEYQGFKFRGEDAGGGLGTGALSFTLDPDGGTLSGKIEGPLGPATLAGVARDGELTFQVAPVAPSEASFRGTGAGAVDGGSASGEIHVSSSHANIVRDATFNAQPQPK